MLKRPADLNLSNWRQPGNNRWAFHHVREIIPSEKIASGERVSAFDKSIASCLADLSVGGPAGANWSLQHWLEQTHSDALLVAHRGELVHEWYFDADIETCPHIVFSVSKSITATLAGVLVDQGLLDPAKPVVDYIPELVDSGYRDASLQQVLDMVVNIDFESVRSLVPKASSVTTISATRTVPVVSVSSASAGTVLARLTVGASFTSVIESVNGVASSGEPGMAASSTSTVTS